MLNRIFRSPSFWVPFLVSLVVISVVFLWELGIFHVILPRLPHIATTTRDLAFSAILWLLLSFTIGLASWRNRETSCPRGVKRATGIAGILGAISLLCPVCFALPIGLVGFSTVLAFLAPFIPLLRIIAIIVLLTTVSLLWPKR